MNLSDRIRRIIQENGLKQKEFAQSIHVTESIQRRLIADIEQMDESELVAVRAFISSLGEYKKTLGIG